MLINMFMTMPVGMGEGTGEAVAGAASEAATAAGGAAATTGGFLGGLGGFLPIIIIFAVMYFLLILPQKKQEKKQRAMIDALKPGDEIITIGGIYGNVVSVKDDAVVIESSADKTKIKIAKSSVSRCLTVKEEEKK